MTHPLLYQINTRVYLGERSHALGRQATFDDIPDALLDQANARGFDWLYFLGVWQTGPMARQVSRSDASLRAGFQHTLPDLKEEDIIGSPFAIQSYAPNTQFGGEAALARLRERLRRRDLKLMLDFVPNHIAPDHEWVGTHPEYLISGTEEDLAREPQNYGRFQTRQGPHIFAYGRDPYFAGWPDTVQLNYRYPDCREAMASQLLRVAERCDGVRCDMAMLLEPEVFIRTWGERSQPRDGITPVDKPFWPEAIGRVRSRYPGFTFMAEVYWDMEWQLQQHGFDYTYDKRLYDRLRDGVAQPVREHLLAHPEFQNHSARFLENHDEPRAARVFARESYGAAAVITYLVPGLRFFHEGQLEGWKTHVSMHLGRRPQEPTDPQTREFYDKVLKILRRPEVHQGTFRLWEPRAAWDGNPTWNNFICFSWHDEADRCLLAAINYAPTQGQCYVRIDLELLSEQSVRLSDLLGADSYDRFGDEMRTRGLYLDMPAWGYQLFEVVSVGKTTHPQAKRVGRAPVLAGAP